MNNWTEIQKIMKFHLQLVDVRLTALEQMHKSCCKKDMYNCMIYIYNFTTFHKPTNFDQLHLTI
jgi:hypothetical protein